MVVIIWGGVDKNSTGNFIVDYRFLEYIRFGKFTGRKELSSYFPKIGISPKIVDK